MKWRGLAGGDALAVGGGMKAKAVNKSNIIKSICTWGQISDSRTLRLLRTATARCFLFRFHGLRLSPGWQFLKVQ